MNSDDIINGWMHKYQQLEETTKKNNNDTIRRLKIALDAINNPLPFLPAAKEQIEIVIQNLEHKR